MKTSAINPPVISWSAANVHVTIKHTHKHTHAHTNTQGYIPVCRWSLAARQQRRGARSCHDQTLPQAATRVPNPLHSSIQSTRSQKKQKHVNKVWWRNNRKKPKIREMRDVKFSRGVNTWCVRNVEIKQSVWWMVLLFFADIIYRHSSNDHRSILTNSF